MSKLEEKIKLKAGDRMCPCGQCNLSAYTRLHSYAMERDNLIKELKTALKNSQEDGVESYGVPA